MGKLRRYLEQPFEPMRLPIRLVGLLVLSAALACAPEFASEPGGQDPSRVGPEVLIARGRHENVEWEFRGYRTRDSRCVRVVTSGPEWTQDTSECAGSGAGFIEPYVISFHTAPDDESWFVFGAVADPRVQSIRVSLHHRVVARRVQLEHRAFPDVRFFIMRLPGDEFVAPDGFRTARFLDESGSRVVPGTEGGSTSGGVERA